MELLFERELAAPPPVVWPLVTDPARMSEWTAAPLVSVSLGEGGRPDAPGAVRAMRTRRLGVKVEVVEAVIEARRPDRFMYRVLRGAGIRDHEGVVSLTATATGTHLVWRIRVHGVVPGWHRVVGFMLKRELGRSLDQLERSLRAAA